MIKINLCPRYSLNNQWRDGIDCYQKIISTMLRVGNAWHQSIQIYLWQEISLTIYQRNQEEIGADLEKLAYLKLELLDLIMLPNLIKHFDKENQNLQSSIDISDNVILHLRWLCLDGKNISKISIKIDYGIYTTIKKLLVLQHWLFNANDMKTLQ